MRRPRLGLPLQDGRQRLQQRGEAPSFLVVGREGRSVGRRRRGGGLGEGEPSTVRSGRLPGALRRPPRHPGGALHGLHTGAGRERARQRRPSWPRRRHGRSPGPAAALGGHPDPDGPAPPASAARRCAGRHGARHRSRGATPPEAPDSALRFRHELWRALGGGQGRLVQGGGDGGNRHLLGRGRDAVRGAGEQQPVLLRAGLRPLRLQHGQGQEMPGVPFQGRAGRKDRDRRPPPGPQGDRSHRQGAGARAGNACRFPPRGFRTGSTSTSTATSRPRSGGRQVGYRSA